MQDCGRYHQIITLGLPVHSGYSIQLGPAVLILPFLNNFRNGVLGEVWMAKFVAREFLQVRVAERNLVLIESILVHVG